MGRIKPRSVATAATPAGSSAKRPRARRVRAAAPATSADHAKPPRTSRAAPDRTPAADVTLAIEPNLAPHAPWDLPSSAPPHWQYTAAAPVAEPSLWQEVSRPIQRRIARRKRDLSLRATQRVALLRLAVRRMQRHAARAWEGRLERLQAVQDGLRRRRHDLAFGTRRKLHRIVAAAFSVIATVWREMRARRLRAHRAAHAWLRRTMESTRAGAGRILERVLQPMRSFRPPQRETIAIAFAVLAVMIVSVAWLVIYTAVAPTRAASTPVAPAAPVAPPAPAKAFTERVIAPELTNIDVPAADVPVIDARATDVPATDAQAAGPVDDIHDAAPAPAVVLPQAAPPLPAPTVRQAAPTPAKRKAAPHKQRRRAQGARPQTQSSPVPAVPAMTMFD